MKEFTCVSCPMGCHLSVTKKENGEFLVKGFACKRGLEYGLQEMKDPRRNISSSVRIENGFLAVLPVKTEKPIPKNLIFQVMEKINSTKITAPVKVGDVIIANVLDTGINIVATRDMPKAK